MRATYFDTPKAAIAVNFKAGSSSLARAVISTYHPQLESLIITPHGNGQGTAYPAGKGPDNTRWQGICPKIDPTKRLVTLMAVREPIEHFRSACAESSISDIDAHLTSLESSWGRDVHFWPQSRLIPKATIVRLYRFPEELDALAVEAGLTLPLPNIDGGMNNLKPTLTDAQVLRVSALYADDVALYTSIQTTGMLMSRPSQPDVLVGYEISKLTVIERLESLGKLEQFLGLLDADPVVRLKWDSASVLTTDYPLFTSQAAAFRTALGLTDSEFAQVIAK